MRYQIFAKAIQRYRSESAPDELEHYEDYFVQREMDNFNFYPDAYLPKVTKKLISSVPFKVHTWKMGDKYYKIAHETYGRSSYGWIIGWFNRSPTESHLTIGDQIFVPTDLNILFSFF